METPFVFGKIATDKNFTDREQETAYLMTNFTSLINTIIISPRRWGKSSLVNKAATLAMEKDSKLRVCQMDLFNVRNEEHFYSLLAQKVVAATSSKWEEVRHNPDEVLDLAEKIAREKGLKIVICVDEFQNISEFAEPDYFQKRLRSHWQQHQHVAYFLYGSKRHMIIFIMRSNWLSWHGFEPKTYVRRRLYVRRMLHW